MSGRIDGGDRSQPSRPELIEEHQYLVKLMRPIFQRAVVSVKARSNRDAARKARRLAPTIKAEEWKGEYDAANYVYDVQEVLNVDEVQDGDGEPIEASEKYLWEEDDFRYLLLKADVSFGEGEVPLQPWLKSKSNLMISDLAGDWVEQIDSLELKARERYRRWLEKRRPRNK